VVSGLGRVSTRIDELFARGRVAGLGRTWIVEAVLDTRVVGCPCGDSGRVGDLSPWKPVFRSGWSKRASRSSGKTGRSYCGRREAGDGMETLETALGFVVTTASSANGSPSEVTFSSTASSRFTEPVASWPFRPFFPRDRRRLPTGCCCCLRKRLFLPKVRGLWRRPTFRRLWTSPSIWRFRSRCSLWNSELSFPRHK